MFVVPVLVLRLGLGVGSVLVLGFRSALWFVLSWFEGLSIGACCVSVSGIGFTI